MRTCLTRRRFLVGAGCACGSAALISRLGSLALADDAPTTWPVTCRDAMLISLKQANTWSALAAIGADGVEIQVADDMTLPNMRNPVGPYSLAATTDVKRFGADAKAAGMRITGFCMSNQFERRPEAELALCGQVAAAAAALGVPAIRIDLRPEKLDRDAFLRFSVDTMRKLIASTESTGVAFGLENHGNTTNDPAFITALMAQVKSKRLGVTLDTANLYWFGHPLAKLYGLYELLAPHVVHTHCKSIRYPAAERDRQRPMGWKYREYACPVDEGDIDFTRVVAILRKAGYNNDLCIEDEFLGKLSPTDATQRLAKQVQFLKRLQTGNEGTGR